MKMQPLIRKSTMRLFEQGSKPMQGLRSFFLSPSENIKDTLSLNLDIVRYARKISINVAKGTGGRYNDFRKFTNKEYFPPEYNEYTDLKSKDMFLRSPGKNEYQPKTSQDIVSTMATNLIKLGEIIERGEIKQAHDALFAGKVTLINGDIIDYDKKTDHNFVPSVKWDNASATPLDEISNGISKIEEDSKRDITEINALCSPRLIDPILKALKAKNVDYADPMAFLRSNIAMPDYANMNGMAYHGRFAINGYTVNLWSYDGRYEIPTGYSIANEGTETTYIPANSLILFPSGVRFDMIYAGVESNNFTTNAALKGNFGISNFMPTIEAGARVIYGEPDMKTFKAVNYGVKASPLAVPTDIDSIYTIQDALS